MDGVHTRLTCGRRGEDPGIVLQDSPEGRLGWYLHEANTATKAARSSCPSQACANQIGVMDGSFLTARRVRSRVHHRHEIAGRESPWYAGHTDSQPSWSFDVDVDLGIYRADRSLAILVQGNKKEYTRPDVQPSRTLLGLPPRVADLSH